MRHARPLGWQVVTSRRAAEKAHAADMVDIEARLAPFFPEPVKLVDDTSAPEPVVPTPRRLVPLRHQPV